MRLSGKPCLRPPQQSAEARRGGGPVGAQGCAAPCASKEILLGTDHRLPTGQLEAQRLLSFLATSLWKWKGTAVGAGRQAVSTWLTINDEHTAHHALKLLSVNV